MKKIFFIMTILFVSLAFCGCTQTNDSNKKSQIDESKWLLKEWEHGDKYPYTKDDLSLYCKDSAVWIEDFEGNKYALNGIAKSLLKNEKKYKGGTDLILKSGMQDLYSPDEALGFCLQVNYENYHQ